MTELQKEKNNNRLLQDELARIRSHKVHLRYESEVLTARQQADTLQHELENKRMQRTAEEEV